MTPDTPNLITEDDYKALESALERQYEESGMRDMVGDLPVMRGIPPETQRAVRGIGDLIFQFGRTYDLSNDDALNQLSRFVVYLSYTRLPVSHYASSILSALLAVRDHCAMSRSDGVSVH